MGKITRREAIELLAVAPIAAVPAAACASAIDKDTLARLIEYRSAWIEKHRRYDEMIASHRKVKIGPSGLESTPERGAYWDAKERCEQAHTDLLLMFCQSDET